MTDQETGTVEEAPAPAKAPRPARKAPAKKAPAKAAAKGKTPAAKAKVVRQPIPAGYTRSRGALIPVATGDCGFAGSTGSRCQNPGRWEQTVGKQRVLSCSNHDRMLKRGGVPKIFAALPPKRASRAKAAAATA